MFSARSWWHVPVEGAAPNRLARWTDPMIEGDPRHVFLTAREVIARYGWGRTKGYEVLRSDGFPRPLLGDRYRLDTLMAWEDSQLCIAARNGDDPPQFPPRKRPRQRVSA